MEPTRDVQAHRLCGNYFPFFGEQSFTACDAVALAFLSLAPRADYVRDYHRAACAAVVAGLRLEGHRELLALLDAERGIPQPAFTLDTGEVLEMGQLLRLRRALLAVYQVNDGVLLGVPFFGGKHYRDRPYQAGVRPVAEWWKAAHDEVATGVRLVDQALCALVGWDASIAITLSALRRDFGYPDPKPVYERWTDSF
jgi:hypothetical protein